MTALFDRVVASPYAQFLGLTAAVTGDELITTLRYAPHLVGNPAIPALHGGSIAGLLENAALFEVVHRAGAEVRPRAITFTAEYLRSAAAVETFARAVITRQGRRVANVRVEAWQADRATLIATATAAFLVS